MKDLDQDLFDRLFSVVKTFTDTYPHLPPAGSPYPFAHLGEVYVEHLTTSTMLLGQASIDLTIWGDKTQRRDVSTLIGQILTASHVINTDTRQLVLDLERTQRNISPYRDPHTDEELWRGFLTLSYNINPKEG